MTLKTEWTKEENTEEAGEAEKQDIENAGFLTGEHQ